MRIVLAAAVTFSLGVFAACSSSESSPGASKDFGLIANADDAGAPEGAALVADLGCHGCHDSSAGIMAGNAAGVSRRVGDAGIVRIYPANLTPDAKTGLGTAKDGWNDAQLARAIRTGVDDECLTLCTAMPRFDLSDTEMASVITYLRALPAVSNEIANQGCPDVPASASGAGLPGDPSACAER